MIFLIEVDQWYKTQLWRCQNNYLLPSNILPSLRERKTQLIIIIWTLASCPAKSQKPQARPQFDPRLIITFVCVSSALSMWSWSTHHTHTDRSTRSILSLHELIHQVVFKLPRWRSIFCISAAWNIAAEFWQKARIWVDLSHIVS